MKTEETLSWITPDMNQEGLTAQVLAYVLGKMTSPAVEDFTWKEIEMVYTLNKEGFEKGLLFKNKVAPLLGQTEPFSSKLIAELSPLENISSLIKNKAIIINAIQFCDNYYGYCYLLARANDEERVAIFSQIKNLTAVELFDKDTVISYVEITKKYGINREAAEIILNTFLLNNPESFNYIAKKIQLNSFQCKAYLNYVEKIDKKDLPSVFQTYLITKDTAFLALLIDNIDVEKESTFQHWLNKIEERVSQTEDKERTTILKQCLPIVAKIMDCWHKEFRNSWSTIINFLPPYPKKKKDENIEKIIAATVSYYKATGRMRYDAFEKWYSYAPLEIWIDIAVPGIITYAYLALSDLAKVADLVSNVDIVTENHIAALLPKTIQWATEDIPPFTAWLKKNNMPLFEKMKSIVEKENYYSIWWNHTKEYSFNIPNFKTLVEAFQ